MKAKEVKRILGVTQQTLYNYNRTGKLKYTIINKYHYNYDDDSVYVLLGKSKSTLTERLNITYSRVSLNKQKNDLTTQSKRLYDYCHAKGIHIELV